MRTAAGGAAQRPESGDGGAAQVLKQPTLAVTNQSTSAEPNALVVLGVLRCASEQGAKSARGAKKSTGGACGGGACGACGGDNGNVRQLHSRARGGGACGAVGTARAVWHAPLLGVEAAPTAVKPATPIRMVDRISARMSRSATAASSSARAPRAARSGSATTAGRSVSGAARGSGSGTGRAPDASIARRAWRAACTFGATAWQLRTGVAGQRWSRHETRAKP